MSEQTPKIRLPYLQQSIAVFQALAQAGADTA